MDKNTKELGEKLLAALKRTNQLLGGGSSNSVHGAEESPSLDHSGQTEDRSTLGTTIAAHSISSKHPQFPPKDSWEARIARWKPRLEFVGIFFAIGYAIITWFQWRDAAKNFKTDERAWIKIQLLHAAQDPPTIKIPDENKPFSIPFYLYNIGKTPARNVVVEGTVVVIPVDQPVPVEGLTPERPTIPGLTRYGGIFPNDSPTAPTFITRANMAGQIVPVTKQEIDGINSGSLYVAVYGMAIYKDIFNDVHWTKFCNWKAAPASVSVQASSCTDANGADEIVPSAYEDKFVK